MDTLVNSSPVSNGTQVLRVYYERWQALDALMTDLYTRYEQHDFPRRDTIRHLLKSLQAFAADQFNFFYYGFIHGEARPAQYKQHLDESPQFPAPDVLYAILDQVGHDLEIIQRAADQRILGGKASQETLANADKLAWRAVKPAIDYAVVEEATTVLTYFQKSTEFYRIPYAQVALIGIPFTCLSTTNHQDYLAIPHEVGHYVYRHPIGNAQSDLEDLRNSVVKISHAYRDWIHAIFEEMFADIYGCLIAGPVMALDLQDVSLAESVRDFKNGDGKHPNPVLRPYIYCQVLDNPRLGELTAEDWRPIAAKLAAHWDAQLKQLNIQAFGIRTTQWEGPTQVLITAKAHKIADAIADIAAGNKNGSHGPLGDIVHKVADTVIEQILKYVEAYGPARQKVQWSGWAGPITAQTEVNDLYKAYEGRFNQLLTEIKLLPPEADPSAVPTGTQPSQLWLDWVQADNSDPKQNKAAQGKTDQVKVDGQWPLQQQQIPSGGEKPLDKMDRGTWGHILWAGGWTTGGPTSDPGHPYI